MQLYPDESMPDRWSLTLDHDEFYSVSYTLGLLIMDEARWGFQLPPELEHFVGLASAQHTDEEYSWPFEDPELDALTKLLRDFSTRTTDMAQGIIRLLNKEPDNVNAMWHHLSLSEKAMALVLQIDQARLYYRSDEEAPESLLEPDAQAELLRAELDDPEFRERLNRDQ